MGWLWKELVERAGRDSEHQVKSVVNRWRERVEPLLRELTALRLTADNKRASISIRVLPGLPAPLEKLDRLPEEAGRVLLGMYLPVLQKYIDSGQQIVDLLRRLRKLPESWVGEIELREETVLTGVGQAIGLIELARENPFLPTLFRYDEDILGCYRYSMRGNETGEIELYWGVIDVVAQQLHCSIEVLTGLTLIHELAHAYTHLGADIVGRRWPSLHFANSDTYVKEGLAQYFLELVAVKLTERNEPEVERAYQALLEHQSPPYRAHLPWLKNHSPEAVRAATLESRARNNGIRISEFETALDQAAERLSGTYSR